MLRDVERGHIKALIFSKLARLARSTTTLLEIAEIFKMKGANLVSLQESLDTSTPAGMLRAKGGELKSARSKKSWWPLRC